MNKLTDAEVVKALECRVDNFAQNVLDLINRQKAEIERLTVENLKMVASIKRLNDETIKEFIEKFKAYIPSIDGDTTMDCVERAIKQAKKEMVGE